MEEDWAVQDLRNQLGVLKRVVEDEAKKTAELLRKKDQQLNQMGKELEKCKKTCVGVQRTVDEMQRTFREALDDRIAQVRAEFRKTFTEELEVSNRAMHNRIDESVNRQFKAGFEALQAECQELFKNIAFSIDRKIEETRADNVRKIEARYLPQICFFALVKLLDTTLIRRAK